MKKVTKLLLIMLLAFSMVMSFIACDKNDEETIIDTTITLQLYKADSDTSPIEEEVLGDVEEYYLITGYSFSTNVAKIVDKAKVNKNYYTQKEEEFVGANKENWKTEKSIYDAISNPMLLTEVTASATAPGKITLILDESGENIGKFYFKNTKGDVVGYAENGKIDCENDTTKTEKTYKVLGIADSAFAGHTEIVTLTVPQEYLFIGQGAFSGCSSIETYTAPFVGSSKDALNGKKSFGYVFGTVEYEGGTSVTQNYNLSGTATYYVPTTLKTVNVNGEVSKYAFYNVTTVEEVTFTNTVVPEYAFYGCTALETVSFDAVTEVKDGAFSGCTAFELSVENLDVIGASAFENCSSFKEVTFKTGVVIGEKAFKGCTSIEELALTNATVKTAAFSGCSALETVAINGCTFSLSAFASWGEMLTISGANNKYVDGAIFVEITDANYQYVFVGAFATANGTQKPNVNVEEFNKTQQPI